MVEPIEPIEPDRRSRRTIIAVTAGVVVAAVLVAYGFSQSDDDRSPATTTSSIIGVIQSPADVATTLAPALSGSAPDTADVPTVPTGTADFVLPPASSDIPPVP